MERYSIYTGKNLSIEKYLQTWKLDNITFEKKDQISKKTALNWFKWSNRSTIVLWDNQTNSLVGYLTPFLINHHFSSKYILNSKSNHNALTKRVFINKLGNINADIYIFSTVIIPKYRDKKITTGVFKGKNTFQILNEAFVDWICEIKKQGVSINYIYAEKVSNDGEKYLKSLGMQQCLSIKDDYKYSRTFNPAMFEKCSNVNKIYELYSIENTQKPFNLSILKNHEYLSVKNNCLYYKDINLYELATKYETPLEVAYTPMITEKIQYLNNLFNKKINKYKYPAKYNYAYATKANYYSEVILTALNNVAMLETSSAYDIDIIYKIAKKGYLNKGFTVICNGYKNKKYIDSLIKLLKLGINVIPIIENEYELELLSKIKDFNINVGIRYNSDFESRLIKNSFEKQEEFDNRFGFDKESCFLIAKKINEQNNLTLKVLHFHFGGTITNIDNYLKGYSNILSCYCELKKKNPSLEYFDFGGGLPVKYSLTYSFDYENLVDGIIKNTLNICKQQKISCPHLIGEHGRFTVADHSFFIYKIDFAKQINNKNWYIINGSLMNMTPDIWGIEQDFTILPLNLYENKCIPICLGGETCDPDDRYYLNNTNVKLFMPTINKDQTLYIGIFSVGAYQEIISGIGGLHHCLIPEGNELIIYNNNGTHQFINPKKEKEQKKIYNLLDYNNKNYIKHFYKKDKF